jgi:hypothetical protein
VVAMNDVPAPFVNRRVAHVHNVLREAVFHEKCNPSTVWSANTAVESRHARVSRKSPVARLPCQPGFRDSDYRRLLVLLC